MFQLEHCFFHLPLLGTNSQFLSLWCSSLWRLSQPAQQGVQGKQCKSSLLKSSLLPHPGLLSPWHCKCSQFQSHSSQRGSGSAQCETQGSSLGKCWMCPGDPRQEGAIPACPTEADWVTAQGWGRGRSSPCCTAETPANTRESPVGLIALGSSIPSLQLFSQPDLHALPRAAAVPLSFPTQVLGHTISPPLTGAADAQKCTGGHLLHLGTLLHFFEPLPQLLPTVPAGQPDRLPPGLGHLPT